MLRYTRLAIYAFIGISALVVGCGTPNYDTGTAQLCTDGKTDGNETDVDCGGSCSPCGVNQACLDVTDHTSKDADCKSSTCINGRCYDPSCRDNKRDNDETDIDCGGSTCPACKDSQLCNFSSDCVNGNPCLNGTCYDSGCNDGKKDNNETDVDCGGDQCPGCDILQSCNQSADCKTGDVCMGGTCFKETCQNNNLDSPETDIDCGGGVCPGCAAGKQCLQNSDCSSGNLCIAGTCYVNTCADGRLDGSETDKDCGGPACPSCTRGKTCNQASDCEASAPCTGNKCGDPQCFDNKRDGTETDLDCGGSNCAGCVNGKTCSSHSDCESLNCSGGTCAAATCSDGSQNQGESAMDCGDLAGLCPRCAAGATCTDDSNCTSKHCVTGVCATATCDDNIQNGNETDIDCGGGCKRCADGKACSQPTDCVNSVCKGNLCKPASCSDGVQNGQETGMDCGGSCQAQLNQTCPNGQGCNSNDDCTFKNCTNGTCQPPTCANGVQDPTETDIDCGGSCSSCPDTYKCLSSADCQSKVCDSSSKTCSKPSCSDQVQNGNETDKDCGGVTCTQRCVTGQKCLANSDCVNKVCDPSSNTCSASTCIDGQQNGNETGPDCGGSCAAIQAKTCGTGLGCNGDTDCASNNCCTAATCPVLNTCVAANCHDGKKNQGESGTDCGGDANTTGCAARCASGQSCQYSTDCDSKVCTGNVCQPPMCSDGVQNGSEMGIDCGGNCATGCPPNTPCSGPGDCDSSVCQKDTSSAYTICAASSCTDGVKNGTETYTDCGGGCKGCAPGQPCLVKTDCDATTNPAVDCINKICSVPSCKDGSIDGSETDTDCGGTCPRCADGKKCLVGADCLSLSCKDVGSGLRCQPASCTDGIVNQGESGIDCGGSSSCNKCGTGYGCTVAGDCVNGVCGSNNTCSAPTCSDGVQNQGETALDCGGPNCRSRTTACADGKACLVKADCLSLWCDTRTTSPGTCTQPSCTDQVQNGTESDIDCGGTCTTKCADTKNCNTNSDCANGWCNSGKCATPACTDNVQNGTETGKDCGGKCAQSCPTNFDSNCKQCADGGGCTTALDCKSLTCTNNTCATPTNCLAKEMDGLGPSGCALCNTGNPSDKPKCMAFLLCYFTNNCNPTTGKDNNGVDCTASGAVCGVNTIGAGVAPGIAANTTYSCACP